jgi:hypothetical protein
MEYFQNLDFSQIISLTFIAFGLVFLFIVVFSVIYSLKARHWTMTIGKIIHSEVCISHDTEDSTDTYRPKIVFEYSVFGEKFICDRLFFGVKIMTNGNLVNSRKLVEKYTVNKEVTVYYNPDKPKQSVIEPGIHNVLGSLFFVSICLVTVGTSMFLKIDLLQRLIEHFKQWAL